MSRQNFLASTLQGFTRALSRALVSEQTAAKNGVLQALDPRVRLIGVFALVVAVTLCRRLEIVAAMFVVATALALTSRVALGTLVLRVWLVVFAFTGSIAMPALFTTPGPELFRFEWLAITETGVRTASMLILRVEAAVTLTTALVLSTPWNQTLRALRALRVPVEVVTMLAMTHRYIFLLIETANQMLESRQSRIVRELRGPEQRRMVTRTAGVLLSKSIDMSNEVYAAMRSRGFRGEVRALQSFRMRALDYAGIAMFLVAAAAAVWRGR